MKIFIASFYFFTCVLHVNANEDRHGKGSVLITSQVPVSALYEIIGEKTVAISIQDRLVHDAHMIEFIGESMRKTRKQASEGSVEIANWNYQKKKVNLI